MCSQILSMCQAYPTATHQYESRSHFDSNNQKRRVYGETVVFCLLSNMLFWHPHQGSSLYVYKWLIRSYIIFWKIKFFCMHLSGLCRMSCAWYSYYFTLCLCFRRVVLCGLSSVEVCTFTQESVLKWAHSLLSSRPSLLPLRVWTHFCVFSMKVYCSR